MKKIGTSALKNKSTTKSKSQKPKVKIIADNSDEALLENFYHLRTSKNKIPTGFIEVNHKGYIVAIGKSNLALWNGNTLYKTHFGGYNSWIKHFLNFNGTKLNNVTWVLDNKAIELLKTMFNTEVIKKGYLLEDTWWHDEPQFVELPKIPPDTPVNLALKTYRKDRSVIAELRKYGITLTTKVGAKVNEYSLNNLDYEDYLKRGHEINPKISKYLKEKGKSIKNNKYQIDEETEKVLRKVNSIGNYKNRDDIIEMLDFNKTPKEIIKDIDIIKKHGSKLV